MRIYDEIETVICLHRIMYFLFLLLFSKFLFVLIIVAFVRYVDSNNTICGHHGVLKTLLDKQTDGIRRDIVAS